MMHPKKYQLLLIAMLLFVPGIVRAAAVVGSFTSVVEGQVDVLKEGETAVVPAHQGDRVSQGDIVRTKRAGKAEIQFLDQTVLRLAPDTRLRVDEYSMTPDNQRRGGFLSLLRGKIRAIVAKVRAGVVPVAAAGSSNFQVKTPTAIAGVKGTDLFVFHERGVTGVVFKDGFGYVINRTMPNRIVSIGAGHGTFVYNPGQPPSPPKPVSDTTINNLVRDTGSQNGPGTGGGQGSPQAGGQGSSGGSSGGDLTGLSNTGSNGGTGDQGSTAPPQSPPPPPPPPPITEMNPSLLQKTPVTVNTTFPR